ncbi:MAG: SGNH/GDSL hydrolase family protein [Puniceicoccaceae bacterium]
MLPVRLPDHPLNCLHLGDSYTIGEGVALEESWPFQLHDLLEKQGIPIARAHILAQTGWTTTDLLQALTEANLQPEWDLITLCIGVNNQYQGLEMNTFADELQNLAMQSLSLKAGPDSIMLILSIPDWGITPFAINRDPVAIASEIDNFNRACARVAASENIPFINWTSLTRSFAGKTDAFAEDGLHPSAAQYASWANFLQTSLIHSSPADGDE